MTTYYKCTYLMPGVLRGIYPSFFSLYFINKGILDLAKK